MALRYPCPNPTCIHEFDGAAVAGAAALTCPVCGMVLQLRVPAPTSVPMATPVASIPMASAVSAIPSAQPLQAVRVPSQPATTVALPTASAPSAAGGFELSEPIVRGTSTTKRRDWLTYSAVIGGFILFVAFGIGAYLVGFRGGATGDGGFVPVRSTDYNVVFQAPGKPWQPHEGLKAALPATLLALHRDEPAAWLALDARRFDYDPAPRELDAEARRKLGKYLKNLETDPPIGSAPKDGVAVAGQPTQRFVFLGDMYLRESDSGERVFERVSGECVMFRFQGIGYWIYSWMPARVAQDDAVKNQLADQFADIRARVSLLGDRADWKQQLQRRTVFTGKAADYQLVDRSGRWQAIATEDPKDRDEKADLVLFAPAPNAKNIIERLQTSKVLVVLLLPATQDAVTSARQYLLTRYRKEAESAVIEPAEESGETVAMPGEPGGKVMKWKVVMPQGSTYFVVAGVAPREKELVVAFAECAWSERNANEVLFQVMIASLQKKQS